MYCKEIHVHYKKVPFGYEVSFIDTFVYKIETCIQEKTEWLTELHSVRYEIHASEKEAMKGV
jgi:hypothetical protein